MLILLHHAGTTGWTLFTQFPPAITIATLLILSVILLLSMFALIMIIPSIRNVIESLIVTFLIELGLQTAFPGAIALLTATGTYFILWLVLWFSVYFFLYGTLSDNLPTWFSFKGRARFITTASPEEVLAATIPAKDNEESYFSGVMEYVGPDEEEEDSYHVRYKLGASVFELQRITILENQPGQRCRYYFMGDVSPANRDFADGFYDVTAIDLGNGKTRVDIYEERPHMRLRNALWEWFDDSVADGADAIRARLEGRRDWSFEGRTWRKIAKLS